MTSPTSPNVLSWGPEANLGEAPSIETTSTICPGFSFSTVSFVISSLTSSKVGSWKTSITKLQSNNCNYSLFIRFLKSVKMQNHFSFFHFFIFSFSAEKKNHSKRYGWVGWNRISWKAIFIRKTNFCTFSIFSTHSYDVLHPLYYLVSLQEKHFLKNSVDFLSGLQ